MALTKDGRVADTKAGRCGPCRGGDHDLCAENGCTCTSRDKHGGMASRDPAGQSRPSGRCRPCQEGHCTVCASDTCTCPDRRKHRRRPGFASANGGGPSSSVRRLAEANGTQHVAPGPQPDALAEPHWELVRADPPAHDFHRWKRKTVVERARPFVERLMADGDGEWHRLVLFPSSAAAAMNAWRLVKAYGEFEWDSCRIDDVDQSAIYVRWTGATEVLA